MCPCRWPTQTYIQKIIQNIVFFPQCFYNVFRQKRRNLHVFRLKVGPKYWFLQCFQCSGILISVRFSLAGSRPKWPKIPFQWPLKLRHPKIAKKRPDTTLPRSRCCLHPNKHAFTAKAVWADLWLGALIFENFLSLSKRCQRWVLPVCPGFDAGCRWYLRCIQQGQVGQGYDAPKADESQSCEAFRLQFMLGRPVPRHWSMLCCVLSSGDFETFNFQPFFLAFHASHHVDPRRKCVGKHSIRHPTGFPHWIFLQTISKRWHRQARNWGTGSPATAASEGRTLVPRAHYLQIRTEGFHPLWSRRAWGSTRTSGGKPW